MRDNPENASESALHEWMDAEFEIANWDPVTTEQALNPVLETLEGVRVLSFSTGRVVLEYDPVAISKAQISAAIEKAGFSITDTKSAPASPLTDALHGEDA